MLWFVLLIVFGLVPVLVILAPRFQLALLLLVDGVVPVPVILVLPFQVVVLLVGTNNHSFPPEQIADGIMANVSAIRRLQPQAFIVVMVTETRRRVS